uniref:Candidate secreted effector n=1 Tax=Meloidogyne incognita TaxID=6306 RepID=A0A914KQ58_MELIC
MRSFLKRTRISKSISGFLFSNSNINIVGLKIILSNETNSAYSQFNKSLSNQQRQRSISLIFFGI